MSERDYRPFPMGKRHLLKITLTPKEPRKEAAISKVMGKGDSSIIAPGPDPPPNGRGLDNFEWTSDSDDTLLGDGDDPLQTPCKSAGRLPVEKALQIPGLMNSGSYKSRIGQGVKRSKLIPRLAYRA